jgi:hypothetical protein
VCLAVALLIYRAQGETEVFSGATNMHNFLGLAAHYIYFPRGTFVCTFICRVSAKVPNTSES